MTVKRFTAPTAREALAKARHAFGDGTIILSNRPTAHGVEVVATAEEALGTLTPGKPVQTPRPMAPSRAIAATPNPDSSVEDDTKQLAMSTLSFQDYVRERMLKRRHELRDGSADTFIQKAAQADSRIRFDEPLTPARKAERGSSPPIAAPDDSQRNTGAPPSVPGRVLEELQAMKDFIDERFNTLNWLGQVQQDPIQINLMLKLVRAGYSTSLSRTIISHMPTGMNAPDAFRWLLDVLERNLHTESDGQGLSERGGVFAMVGSTGVGKTTSAAKLAAQCAHRFGPSSVGLITLDTQRAGAHEQLRAHGRALGIVTHLAHDKAALQELLGLLGNKRLVLIDTMGLAPRDPARKDLLDTLDLPRVHRLLVLAASMQGDAIDESIAGLRGADAMTAVLTKVDETVRIGPALDCLIRNQVCLCGTGNGQRVPDDWQEARSGELVRHSMRAPVRAAFDYGQQDLRFLFADGSAKSNPPIFASNRA